MPTSGLSGFGSWRHLAGRFFSALSPTGPPAYDEQWALEWLLPGEKDLWARMSGPDRRHAVQVAKDVIEDLGADVATRAVVAAALLHDVGKVEAAMGTLSRVLVTLATVSWGRERMLSWSRAKGAGRERSWRARAGRYITHDKLGAELLETAGSDGLTVTWAREHHLPSERWALSPEVTAALKAADGD